jgi:O-antigen ligase
LYVLSIPIGAGIGAARGVQIAGFNYTGWLWLAYLAAGVMVLLTDRAMTFPRRPIAFPYGPWLPWVGLVWLSILWLRDPVGVGVQDAMQVTMPVLCAVVASIFVTTERQIQFLVRSFLVTLVLLYLTVLMARVGEFDDVDFSTAMRPLGMTAALISAICLAQPWKARWRYFGWGLCLVVGLLTQARIITVSMIVLPLLNPVAKGMFKRIALGASLAVLSVAVFYSSAFQARFFYSGSGTLTDVLQGKVDTSGRFEAWPDVWNEAWRHPIQGSGIGSTHAFVSHIWDDVNLVHCDFLRVGFELGLVGVALFILVFSWQTWDLWRGTRTTSGWTRAAFGGALMGMIVFWVNAATDNPLGYNLWYMDPLFALIGAAYGVARAEAMASSAANGGQLYPQSE